MISQKGKRQIEYSGNVFYWFVRRNNVGVPQIHILSEDKKTNLQYPLFDLEVPVTPAYIKHLLDKHFEK